MYGWVLFAHSALRYVLLVFLVVALGRALAGWFGRREWGGGDDATGRWLTITADVQLILGLLLYFGLSSIAREAITDIGAAMGERVLRYWGVEHMVGMIVGIALIHVGRATSKRAPTALQRHRRAAIWFGLALLVILASIPWPFMGEIGRAWLPEIPGM